MRENGTQNIASGRRLQMSLSETYLQRSINAEAKLLLTDLQRAFSSSGILYSTRQHVPYLGVFCKDFSSTIPWVEAISCWRHALGVLDHLKLNGGFNAGIVRSSIAHALMMTGGETESKDIHQEAKANMASDPRVFWIPLFNFQWHDFIFDVLKKAGVD
jgi:hypothetical protein